MLETFLATLNPMLTLFICIVIGFTLNKTKLLPQDAGNVIAKLEMWVFCPALSFSAMSTFCTIDTIKFHAVNIVFASIVLTVEITIAILLARVFVPQKCDERGIYIYALAFANYGYVGDPLVLMLFGDEVLSYFKLFCLPITIMTYAWGIGHLMPSGEKKGGFLKNLLNPPTVAMLVGMVVGLTGIGKHMPGFLTTTLDSLKVCMGPLAMILAGFTIADYEIKSILRDKKLYFASGLRLIVLPAILVAVAYGVKVLAATLFQMEIGHTVLYLALFATAGPLGLNTVVFPAAYGGNPKTGAGMALVSHTLCVVTIPLMYALMVMLFGPLQI